MAGAAFLLTLLPIIGINAGSFTVSVVIACVVFAPLGMIVGFYWAVPSWRLGVLGSIPAWFFLLALYNWSVPDMLGGTMDGVPVLLLPLASMISGYGGASVGTKIAMHRKIISGSSHTL